MRSCWPRSPPVRATYRRRVAKVTGVGVRRFSTPEDVADFVANVFLEVMESAGSHDPRRGNAVTWLYGLAGNVAAGMRRRLLELVTVDGLNTGAAAKVLGVTAVATRVCHNHHGGEVIAKGP